jgi:thiamine biosynthesis lipoprotein
MRSDRFRSGSAFARGLLFAALPLLTSCSSLLPEREPLTRHEFTRTEMGLPFRIVLYAPNPPAAQGAAEAAFARIHALNGMLSDYEYDSELSRLSRTAGSGQKVPVSDDLWTVLQQAQRWAQRSEGAFDITVGPYVSLWRRARRQKELPSEEWIERVRPAVGYQHLRLSSRGHTAELLVPNMRLDLGGIAKGYAVDEAMKVLRERGITRALVGGAGDMLASGPPPGQKGWRIAVAPLDTPDAPPARQVLLAHRAIATSGDLNQRLEIGGKRYSHIVDPQTGMGLTHHTLVTVIAKDCTTADALATAVSVLGPERGTAFVDRTHGVAVHLVGRPGNELVTKEAGGFGRFWETRVAGR